jgi:hypothetical protein
MISGDGEAQGRRQHAFQVGGLVGLGILSHVFAYFVVASVMFSVYPIFQAKISLPVFFRSCTTRLHLLGVRELLALIPLHVTVSLAFNHHTRQGNTTYMLNDTPTLPSIPINNLSKRSRLVIQPTLWILKRRAQRRNVLRAPDWREYVPCRVETVLSSGVVVLLSLACNRAVPIMTRIVLKGGGGNVQCSPARCT